MAKQFSPPLTIQVCDMDDKLADTAQKVIKDAFETEREERKIAQKIKADFDKQEGKPALQ